jgi:hypothetical protein
MKEAIIFILLILIYLFISFYLHRLLLRIDSLVFLLLTIAYYVLTFYLYDFLVYGHGLLTERKIDLDFGHYDQLLVEVYLIWTFIATVNIIVTIFRRYGSRRNGNDL